MERNKQAENTGKLEDFAVRLKTAMSRRGVVLREVAAAVDKGISTVNAWTNGQNWPEVETLKKLCRFLEVSPDHLIYGQPANSGIVEETQAAYASPKAEKDQTVPGQLRDRIEEHVAGLLRAAGNDPQRLGWIAEQLAAHIDVPAHWNVQPPKGKSPGSG